MPKIPLEREIAFNLKDVARLLRTYVDQQASQAGTTHAQWAVLARLERTEGLKQCELADTLELQPITLTRLIDRLCESGLIERRPDPVDRRVKRLFLTAAARPVLARLSALGQELMATVLKGVDTDARHQLLDHLLVLKTNLRGAIARKADERADEPAMEQSHG